MNKKKKLKNRLGCCFLICFYLLEITKLSYSITVIRAHSAHSLNVLAGFSLFRTCGELLSFVQRFTEHRKCARAVEVQVPIYVHCIWCEQCTLFSRVNFYFTSSSRSSMLPNTRLSLNTLVRFSNVLFPASIDYLKGLRIIQVKICQLFEKKKLASLTSVCQFITHKCIE